MCFFSQFLKLNKGQLKECKSNTGIVKPFPRDNFRKQSKKTNPKVIILEILVYKIQPEIIKSKVFTCFDFITKPCLQEQNYQQNVQTKQVNLKCPINK